MWGCSRTGVWNQEALPNILAIIFCYSSKANRGVSLTFTFISKPDCWAQSHTEDRKRTSKFRRVETVLKGLKQNWIPELDVPSVPHTSTESKICIKETFNGRFKWINSPPKSNNGMTELVVMTCLELFCKIKNASVSLAN